MATTPWATIVIGAGAAGLAAARTLSLADHSVLIVEARDRIGGRAYTIADSRSPVPIELGAEFIHGRPQVTFDLLREAGVAAIDGSDALYEFRDGELCAAADPFAAVGELMRRLDPEAPDESVDAFLERFAGDPALQQALTWTRMAVEGFDAADPAIASIRAIAEEWSAGTSIQTSHFRPLGGYTSLLTHLARSLPPSLVRLSLCTTVSEVEWEPGSVVVRGCSPAGAFEASAGCAVVTVPVGVLQRKSTARGGIRFSPPLPLEKRLAIEQLAMGPVFKVVLRFASAFWEEIRGGAYRDAAFFHAPETSFPTFWTTLPLRSSMLVAWAGGTRAARLVGAGHGEIVGLALEALGTIFGAGVDVRAQLEAAYFHDWQRDPSALGAYSYAKVGGADARAVLAAPVASTLFFAGEATASNADAGTVAAALETGVRAAREIAS